MTVQSKFKRTKCLSPSEKARLLLEEFPELGKTEVGKDFCLKLMKMVESQGVEQEPLHADIRSKGFCELLSIFPKAKKPMSGMTSHGKNKNILNLNTSKAPEQNYILGANVETLMSEHPAILISKFEKLSCDEKERNLKCLPGSIARQVSFLLANR